ncbi:hypothetical protein [Streptomyces sp. NPDC048419]|uniref:hypothetical protein n=1 Tax=Streptomyces sp. NPDC048419 TaxID=3365547 RepID=UPI00371565CA
MRKILSAWWAGLAFWLAAGVLATAALTCLASLVLIGLPHGWDTATSSADVRLRFSWIAVFLLPAAVSIHVVLWLCIRDRGRTRGADSPRPQFRPGIHAYPRPSRRGGQHR